MPLPVALVVKNGSNARSSVSSSMPTPLSLTDKAIMRPARASSTIAVRIVEQAAVGHRVAGVDGDVEQGRFELGAVGLDRAGVGREDGPDLDPLAQRAVEQVGHAADQRR